MEDMIDNSKTNKDKARGDKPGNPKYRNRRVGITWDEALSIRP